MNPQFRSGVIAGMCASVLGVVFLPAAPCFPGPGVAWADDADSTPSGLRKHVDELLKALDHPQAAERAHAERTLLERGPEVLPFLPPPERIRSVAVREAIARIRIQLERRAARESALASRVSLDGEHTVHHLLRELYAQTRNRIGLAPQVADRGTRSLTVHWEQTPFWEAVDDLARQLDLHPEFDAAQGQVLLQSADSNVRELAVQRRGPFRFAVLAAQVRPIVGDDDHRLLRITGRLALEPRLRPLFVHFAAADLGVDGLAPWNRNARYELPLGDAGRAAPVQFDFVLPAKDRRATLDLRGKLQVHLAAATEHIRFDQTALAAGTIRRRGGVSVRLREVAFDQQPGEPLRAEIKVLVGYDTGGPAFESYRTWVFHNAASLESSVPGGPGRVTYSEFDTSLQSNGAIGVDYRWDRLTGPASQYEFVYEAPTLLLDLPLDLDVRAIPVSGIPQDATSSPDP